MIGPSKAEVSPGVSMAKTLCDAINDIIENIRSSSAGQTDPWLEIIKQCKPPGIIDASYCEPVEEAVKKYISDISDEDKRSIWLDTEIGQMEQDTAEDIYITSIEVDLHVLLFEEVMHQAFLEAKEDEEGREK